MKKLFLKLVVLSSFTTSTYLLAQSNTPRPYDPAFPDAVPDVIQAKPFDPAFPNATPTVNYTIPTDKSFTSPNPLPPSYNTSSTTYPPPTNQPTYSAPNYMPQAQGTPTAGYLYPSQGGQQFSYPTGNAQGGFPNNPNSLQNNAQGRFTAQPPQNNAPPPLARPFGGFQFSGQTAPTYNSATPSVESAAMQKAYNASTSYIPGSEKNLLESLYLSPYQLPPYQDIVEPYTQHPSPPGPAYVSPPGDSDNFVSLQSMEPTGLEPAGKDFRPDYPPQFMEGNVPFNEGTGYVNPDRMNYLQPYYMHDSQYDYHTNTMFKDEDLRQQQEMYDAFANGNQEKEVNLAMSGNTQPLMYGNPPPSYYKLNDHTEIQNPLPGQYTTAEAPCIRTDPKYMENNTPPPSVVAPCIQFQPIECGEAWGSCYLEPEYFYVRHLEYKPVYYPQKLTRCVPKLYKKLCFRCVPEYYYQDVTKMVKETTYTYDKDCTGHVVPHEQCVYKPRTYQQRYCAYVPQGYYKTCWKNVSEEYYETAVRMEPCYKWDLKTVMVPRYNELPKCVIDPKMADQAIPNPGPDSPDHYPCI